MSDRRHEEIKELLAVCALNAAGDDEQQLVEEHIASCDACRQEFDEYRRTSALLGASPALPPENVWENVSARIQPPPPPLELVRAKAKPRRLRLLAAAAAVLVVAGASTAAAALWPEDDDLVDVAREARTVPGAKTTVLKTSDGREMAQAVVLPDGRGFIYEDNMPAVADDRTYQLWAVVSGTTLSAGVLGNDPCAAAFTVSGEVSALAITEEHAGGVVSSSNQPAAVGAFA